MTEKPGKSWCRWQSWERNGRLTIEWADGTKAVGSRFRRAMCSVLGHRPKAKRPHVVCGRCATMLREGDYSGWVTFHVGDLAPGESATIPLGRDGDGNTVAGPVTKV